MRTSIGHWYGHAYHTSYVDGLVVTSVSGIVAPSRTPASVDHEPDRSIPEHTRTWARTSEHDGWVIHLPHPFLSPSRPQSPPASRQTRSHAIICSSEPSMRLSIHASIFFHGGGMDAGGPESIIVAYGLPCKEPYRRGAWGIASCDRAWATASSEHVLASSSCVRALGTRTGWESE